jgi:hypothetical protein
VYSVYSMDGLFSGLLSRGGVYLLKYVMCSSQIKMWELQCDKQSMC